MRGTFFIGKEQFEVREFELPPPGENDLVIKNMACGVCGTDVHIYHGEPGSAEVTPPVVIGHEYSGVVEEVGALVKGFNRGDRVTIDPNIYCGSCRYCRIGKKQLCEKMGAVGVNRNGGFAEYSLVPEKQAHLLGENVDFETGAMAEPLACCVHGIDLAGIKTGDTVLIIGGGAIGLLMTQLAKLSGASRVIVSEPVEKRREVAYALGADACFDPFKTDPAKEIFKFTNKKGADVVIECAGQNAATRQAFDAAAKGATVLLFSVPPVGAEFNLPLHDVFMKELTIRGSFVNPDTHSRAVELLNAGKIDVKPLITHRFGLNEAETAIKTQMSGDSIKVLIKPWS